MSSFVITVTNIRIPALRFIQPSLQCIVTEVSLGIRRSELEGDRQDLLLPRLTFRETSFFVPCAP
jgi:hypothetical protein